MTRKKERKTFVPHRLRNTFDHYDNPVAKSVTFVKVKKTKKKLVNKHFCFRYKNVFIWRIYDNHETMITICSVKYIHEESSVQ